MGNKGRSAARARSERPEAEVERQARGDEQRAADERSSPAALVRLPSARRGQLASGAALVAQQRTEESQPHEIPTVAGASDPSSLVGVARESPSKITHGFWLQQYTWLHEDNSHGGASDDASGTQLHSETLATTPTGRPKRRNKLLVKWSSLMRSFGGSASEQLEETSASPQAPKSPSRLSRLLETEPAPISAPETERKGRAKNWFMESLSSSASTLLSPRGPKQHQKSASSRVKPAERRAQSSCGGTEEPQKATNSGAKHQLGQFAAAFSPRRRKARGLESETSQSEDGNEVSKRARLRQLPAVQSNSSGRSEELALLAAAEASTPSMPSQGRDAGAGRREQAGEGTKRGASQDSTRPSTSGGRLLGALFGSPLFRRGETLGADSAKPRGGAPHDKMPAEATEISSERDGPADRKRNSKRAKKLDWRGDAQRAESRVSAEAEFRLQLGRRAYANEAPKGEEEAGERAEASFERRTEARGVEHPGAAPAPAPGSIARQETQLEQTVEGGSHRMSGCEQALLPLIQPLGASSASSCSSSVCALLEGSSEAALITQREPPAAPVGLLAAAALTSERPASQPVSETPATPVSGRVGVAIRDNFKRLVKRQQSVDSYRMARDLKNKQRRARQGHQSNEAIKGGATGGRPANLEPRAPGARKFSMHAAGEGNGDEVIAVAKLDPLRPHQAPLKICIDPYAKPGSFTLPGEEQPSEEGARVELVTEGAQLSAKPTPPNTLSLSAQPTSGLHLGTFSGHITPTYPTHHLPSPKYVSPAQAAKKYSNASTISSSIDYTCSLASWAAPAAAQQLAQSVARCDGATNNHSDTESSTGGGSATPSKASASAIGALPTGQRGSCSPSNLSASTAAAAAAATVGVAGVQGRGVRVSADSGSAQTNKRSSLASAMSGYNALAQAAEEAAAALAARANLAEHIYDNKCGLGEDMKFLASLPELCDITFLVGETREPVCAVKSVLAARSRVFHKILFGSRIQQQQHQQQLAQQLAQQQQSTPNHAPQPDNRRGSSPRAHGKVQANKSSSPLAGRSPSPQVAPSGNQWSVTSDATGYAPPSSTTPTMTSQPTGGRGSCDEAGSPAHSGSRSGRNSVARSGRDSVSAASQSSQQPLIIGPGQLAAPAKRTKKSSIRDSRLSRMFLRRASDPALNGQPGGAASQTHWNQSYLDKMSSLQMSTTMIIEEFEPDVFRQLIEYIHTGCVLLQARTLLGLLNAADYYGLEQLRRACLRFVSCCISVDTVCSLLSTAERYIQYKCTKSIVQKVLEFVDSHANEIFKLNAFGLLPEHVVRLILARDGLQADEQVKYSGVYTWCEHYCRSYELTNIADVMRNFLDLIQFHKIPTNVLLSEIYPTHIVPDNIFLSALAYQADPQNFEPLPVRARRMTLPNPMICTKDDDQRRYSPAPPSESALADSMIMPSRQQQPRGPLTRKESHRRAGSKRQRRELARKQSSGLSEQSVGSSGRKSLGGQPSQSEAPGARLEEIRASHRKGSIAQVSISGVMRLSRKLSIKKWHSNISAGVSGVGLPNQQRDRASIASSGAAASSCDQVARQQSAPKDPVQLGQQILNAYLVRQRQLEEEQRLRQEELEAQQLAARRSQDSASEWSQEARRKQQQQQPGAGQPIVKISSTRKSFRDFKHISRRLFMRHSNSSKLLQQSASLGPSSGTHGPQPGEQREQAAGARPADAVNAPDRRRKLLKIKRSETVFEATPSVMPGARLAHQHSSSNEQRQL